MREIPLREGRTEVFTVSETGKTLVAYANGTEKMRKPLKLLRGEVNAIKL